MYMKATKLYQIACLIAVYLLVGCGIYSKKSQLEQKMENSYKQHQDQHLLFHQTQKDSLSTYWYFWTDSLLSFRPDSGLNAKGGLLYVQQSRSRFAEKKLATRQKNTLATGTLDSVTKRDRSTFSFDALLIAFAISLALLYLIWWVRRKML